MNENSNHLISRLKWDTSFDSKTQAAALQNRLSDWSGLLLKEEITAVFDKLCPPHQTWKIPLLELDLGTIDFQNLEVELSAKIRRQLNEKLTELILYSHQHGRRIEILDGKKSALELIRYFLQHGLLPWNYQLADGSINQILTAHLQENPKEVIAVLKELGFSAAQVRQRMAWQFTEPNMIRIINGMEPNVGGQIILFSSEFTKIQQKETIVQAGGTADFKKHLWLWILNYLLTERGTVFNRLQFMKSSIVQMAAHYNLQYNQLFELIEAAVDKLNSSFSLQPDFITTLQLLSKEHKSRKKHAGIISKDSQDYWLSLSVLIRDQTLNSSDAKKAEFNELVSVLSAQNKAQFFALIRSFGTTADFWLSLINGLSDDTLTTLLFSLKGRQSKILAATILFINQLTGGMQSSRERNLLWYTGILLISEHKNKAIDQSKFLHSLITALSEHKKLTKIALLDQLMAAEVPHALKNLLHTEVYQALNTVYMHEISGATAGFLKKHIQQLMEMLHQQRAAGKKDNKLMETLQNYVRLQPKAVKEAYTSTPYQKSMQLLLPNFITGKTAATIKQQVLLRVTDKMWAATEQQILQAGADGLLENLIDVLVNQQRVPQSFNALNPQEITTLIIKMYPDKFFRILQKGMLAAPQLTWLNEVLGFNVLLNGIAKLDASRQYMLDSMEQLYRALGVISVPGISAVELQFILFKKVMQAWVSGNWKLVAPENIWNELTWEVCTKRSVSKTEFLKRIDHGKLRFPPALRMSFESLMDHERLSRKAENHKVLASLPKTLNIHQKEHHRILEGGIHIRNAGMVLINSYLSTLLTRLDLINTHKKFVSAGAQLAAVHYLQFVVTGLEGTPESVLPLNKLLCGIPLAQPVMEREEISNAHKLLIDGLITAIISHWPSIGKCSVDGFRGNWLVRDGVLIEKEERWELTVEKKAYDLLIHRSPFSFSVIRHPWMDKPIHVIWPY